MNIAKRKIMFEISDSEAYGALNIHRGNAADPYHNDFSGVDEWTTDATDSGVQVIVDLSMQRCILMWEDEEVPYTARISEDLVRLLARMFKQGEPF
jgi:hypothetical protein